MKFKLEPNSWPKKWEREITQKPEVKYMGMPQQKLLPLMLPSSCCADVVLQILREGLLLNKRILLYVCMEEVINLLQSVSKIQKDWTSALESARYRENCLILAKKQI